MRIFFDTEFIEDGKTIEAAMVDKLDDAFRVQAADLEPCVFSNRREALEQFQQACNRGVWCDVWQIYGANSGVKIADFPGLS